MNYGLFSVETYKAENVFFHTGLGKWGQVNGKYSAHMIGQNPVFVAIRLADLPRSVQEDEFSVLSLFSIMHSFVTKPFCSVQ